jgi:YggT family protein
VSALGFLLDRVAMLLHLVLQIYIWILVARAIISWVNPDPSNPIVRFLHRATEPVLRPVRNVLPLQGLGLDLSPLVVLLAIYVLDMVLVDSLREIASSLR